MVFYRKRFRFKQTLEHVFTYFQNKDYTTLYLESINGVLTYSDNGPLLQEGEEYSIFVKDEDFSFTILFNIDQITPLECISTSYRFTSAQDFDTSAPQIGEDMFLSFLSKWFGTHFTYVLTFTQQGDTVVVEEISTTDVDRVLAKAAAKFIGWYYLIEQRKIYRRIYREVEGLQ